MVAFNGHGMSINWLKRNPIARPQTTNQNNPKSELFTWWVRFQLIVSRLRAWFVARIRRGSRWCTVASNARIQMSNRSGYARCRTMYAVAWGTRNGARTACMRWVRVGKRFPALHGFNMKSRAVTNKYDRLRVEYSTSAGSTINNEPTGRKRRKKNRELNNKKECYSNGVERSIVRHGRGSDLLAGIIV